MMILIGFAPNPANPRKILWWLYCYAWWPDEFLGNFSLSIYRRHKLQWIVSFLVLITCSLVGILLEYSQLWFTLTRQFSYYDAIANVFGAVLGLTLFWCYRFVVIKSNK